MIPRNSASVVKVNSTYNSLLNSRNFVITTKYYSDRTMIFNGSCFSTITLLFHHESTRRRLLSTQQPCHNQTTLGWHTERQYYFIDNIVIYLYDIPRYFEYRLII